MREYNLGTIEQQKPVFISNLLTQEESQKILKVLTKYNDCFAWDYTKMPGLDKKVVEHKLPIKPGFKPF